MDEDAASVRVRVGVRACVCVRVCVCHSRLLQIKRVLSGHLHTLFLSITRQLQRVRTKGRRAHLVCAGARANDTRADRLLQCGNLHFKIIHRLG
jgi:hypothetical protein